MTDRELLELAAKAAGMRVGFEPDGKERGRYDLYWSHVHHQLVWHGKSAGAEYPKPIFWNPIAYNGDALRLFCAIPWMCIETSDLAATVCERGKPDEPSRVYLMWTEWLDKHNGDLAAATRRAIVRAAAEMQLRRQKETL